MTQPEVGKLRVLLTRTCQCVWNEHFNICCANRKKSVKRLKRTHLGSFIELILTISSYFDSTPQAS